MTDLEGALDTLQLSGRAVCCHASMRSFSPRVDAGTLLDAMAAKRITVMVPTFTYHFEVPPPDGVRPARNGMDYSRRWPASPERFTTAANALSRGPMGALPAAVLERTARVRGAHPLNSFTAVGPLASELIASQDASNVYRPLEALVERDGMLLMIGVDTRSLTFVHYAEALAGRRLFIRWAMSGDQVVPSRVGSCSNGFDALMPTLLDVAATTSIQGSTWIAVPARKARDALVRAIRNDPEVTRCSDPACLRCRDAIAGGPD